MRLPQFGSSVSTSLATRSRFALGPTWDEAIRRANVEVLVSLAINNARNSLRMFRKPLSHLAIRPRPLEGMSVACVVIRP